MTLQYVCNVVPEQYKDKIFKLRERDIILGSTSIGPHKDDLNFYIDDIEAKSFASQGQQRSVILSLKLALINIYENKYDEKPILLLDDVLSELDLSRQLFLLEEVKNCQVILTCTGVEDLLNKYMTKNESYLFEVKGGEIL